jgi:hypothetical protein
MRKTINRLFTVLGLGLILVGSLQAQETDRSIVVVWKQPDLVKKLDVDVERVSRAFHQSLCRLTSTRTPQDAWKRLGIVPKDIVGIKIATFGGPELAQYQPLLKAIISGVHAVGVPTNNIIIWDKYEDNMAAAGFPIGKTIYGENYMCVVPQGGYDPETFYFHEVVGQLIWGDYEFRGRLNMKTFDLGEDENDETLTEKEKEIAKKNRESNQSLVEVSNRSYYANLFTKQTTKIINISFLTDFQGMGMSGVISGLAFGGTDNNRRFQTLAGTEERAASEILAHPAVKDKVILHILDGMLVQYAGGPSFEPNFAKAAGLMIISQDPVAVDALGLEYLDKIRAAEGMISVRDQSDYLKAAEKTGLGTMDKANMRLIMLP